MEDRVIARQIFQAIVEFVRNPTPTRVWVALFACWGLFLSGALGGVGLLGGSAAVSGSAFGSSFGPPGILQAIRLGSLLETKNRQIEQLHGEIAKLQNEATGLEKSRVLQQREIRKVLGYAAADELIFDFTPRERL